MKEVIFSFLVALVLGAAVNQFMSPQSSSAPPSTEQQPAADGNTANAAGGGSASAATTEMVSETTDSSFDTDVLQASEPVFVDFYATWCQPCKKMMPVVAQLSNQYAGKVKFFRVDVDKQKALAAKYQISAIPTFIVFKAGKRVDSFAGVVPAEDLSQVLQKTL